MGDEADSDVSKQYPLTTCPGCPLLYMVNISLGIVNWRGRVEIACSRVLVGETRNLFDKDNGPDVGIVCVR